MKKKYNLTQRILQESVHNSYWLCKEEWFLHSVWFDEAGSTCVCGKTGIKKICILQNKFNKKMLLVGSCCTEKVLGIPTDNLLKRLKMISKDLTQALKKLNHVTMFFRKGVISCSDYDFYINTHKKRPDSLSTRQLTWRVAINKKIILYMAAAKEQYTNLYMELQNGTRD